MASSINDISTDLDDPPKYRHADIGDLPDNFKPAISESYPDLAPLVLKGLVCPPLFSPSDGPTPTLAASPKP